MSFNRKNWSALSSLARQRTLEDEEEQERERRRRNRNLSSTTDAEEEALSPVQDTDKQAVERLQRLKEAEPPAAATAEEEVAEQKLPAVPRPQEIRRQRWQAESSENLRREKEQPGNCREPEREAGRLEAALGRGSAQDALAGEQRQEVAREPKGPKAEPCPESAPEQKVRGGERHRGSAREETDLVTDKPLPEPEVTEDQPRGQARECKDQSHLEVKVSSRGGSRIEQKPDPPVPRPSSQQDTARNPAPAQEAAGPASTQGSSVPSPTPVTYSSSFRRISPRTVSFRVISRKDQEENAFTRSASVRLPANSVRIEEKLEKYTSAVQRSEVKSPVSVPRGFPLSSEGVASKRSIFEASAPSKANPAPIRKENLKLPGVVTSRINLWISRTQEPIKEGGVKDAGRTDSATKRSLWAKRPDEDSSDTRL